MNWLRYALLTLLFVISSHSVANIADTNYNWIYCATIGGMHPGPVCPPEPPPGPDEKTGLIAFADIIDGPDTGLGYYEIINDEVVLKGSGTLVTLWGWFNETQGTSTVEFCDSDAETPCKPAEVFYWKNADGQLPGGPANLYRSHGMQEIAVSVPDSANGEGYFKITVEGVESHHPFTVRAGQIFHVKSNGSNENNGTFSMPFATVAHAVDNTPAGSIIYIHDVDAGAPNANRGIYKAKASANSSKEARFAIASFPNDTHRVKITGKEGVQGYQQDALVFSKLAVFSSNYAATDENDQETNAIAGGPTFCLKGTAFGRIAGNSCTDQIDENGIEGCASKTQGAIVSGGTFRDEVSELEVLGNHIYNYGCAGSYKLHHTTYFTIRSNDDPDNPDDLQVKPQHVAYMFLENNPAKNGIHFHDEDDDCGNYTDRVWIDNNVIINQGGASITYQVSGCDRYEPVTIMNNLIMNSGLPAEWNGLSPSSSKGHDGNGITIWDSGYNGKVTIKKNTIIGWNRDNINSGSGCIGVRGSQDGVEIEAEDNICVALYDRSFFGVGYKSGNKTDNIHGEGNILYYVSGNATYPPFFNDAVPTNYPYSYHTNPDTPINAVAPTNVNWINHVYDNPMITFDDIKIIIDDSSPAKGTGTTSVMRNLYGEPNVSNNKGAR